MRWRNSNQSVRGVLVGITLCLGLGAVDAAHAIGGGVAERTLSRHLDTPSDTTTFRPRRLWTGVAGFVAADVLVMWGLNRLWYADHERTRFHWYNDWGTYAQQDKAGHFLVAWHLARVFGEYGQWSGLSRRDAGIFGGLMSAAFQSQVELFDGFSEAFGASGTDILANVLGGAIGGAKVAFPDRLSWFDAKYSYHPSPYYKDDVSSFPPFRYLGNALKDYDGISYWLIVRPTARFEAWPNWLGLSLGYSGTGLAHPLSGRSEEGHRGGPVHQRQIYVGPDLDILSLRDDWPQPFRAVAGFFSFLRLPAPALQLTPDVRWYWVYY